MRRFITFGVLLLVLWSFFPSCKSSGGSGMMEAENAGYENSEEAFVPDTLVAGSRDTTIIVRENEATIKGHLEGNKTAPTYLLPAWKGQTLVVVIKPLKKGGKLRIREIIQPGGISEGPFSDSFSYKFTCNGNMRLVLDGNTGSGKPYTGDYYLHITIK